MKSLLSLGVASVITLAGLHSADAGRKLIMLIDATGSMMTPRTPPNTGTRFDAAKTSATFRIRQMAMETAGLDGAAVFVFFDQGFEARTNGYIDPFEAARVVEGLTVTPLATPLATGLCQAIDHLAANVPASDQRVLEVKTDGEENNSTLLCAGPPSDIPSPFRPGSWHHQVLSRALANNVRINPQLFVLGDVGLAANALKSLAVATLDVAPLHTVALLDEVVGDVEFFDALAIETGGVFILTPDDEVIPVPGDTTGDECTDIDDALLIVRNFTRRVTPDKARFDLNDDAVIGFADYFLAVLSITPQCARPDPLVQLAPVECRGSGRVVIDGRKIEDANTTLDIRGACHVTIRNSRIVSGASAIRIHGSAALVIDNSVIAGERAVLVLNGSATLSARNTFFKGRRDIRGSFRYDNRGGNTWE
jgi:hypothetical protein